MLVTLSNNNDALWIPMQKFSFHLPHIHRRAGLAAKGLRALIKGPQTCNYSTEVWVQTSNLLFTGTDGLPTEPQAVLVLMNDKSITHS